MTELAEKNWKAYEKVNKLNAELKEENKKTVKAFQNLVKALAINSSSGKIFPIDILLSTIGELLF